MNRTYTLLFAAVMGGLAVASSQTYAAGPMLSVGALVASSAKDAVTMIEPAVVVVRRRAVVRRPVVRRRVIIR